MENLLLKGLCTDLLIPELNAKTLDWKAPILYEEETHLLTLKHMLETYGRTLSRDKGTGKINLCNLILHLLIPALVSTILKLFL